MRVALLHGIQGKLVGLYLALTIASLVALTILFDQATSKIISSSIRSHLQTIAESQTALISRWMEEREHDVEVLAKNAAVRRHALAIVKVPRGAATEARRELAALLRLVRDQYQAYHAIAVVDRDGNVLATTTDEVAPAAVEDESLLKNVRQRRPYVSGLYRYGDEVRLSLDIAAPIEGGHGAVAGAIIAKIDLEVINLMTDSMRLMESGEAYLVDRRGVFITHRDRRRVFRDDISHIVGVASVIGGRRGVGEYTDYRGVSVLGAYQWLPRWQWGLLAEVDHSEAFQPIAATRRTLLLIVALITAAVLLGTLLVARRIVRPLRELTSAVQAVAAGKMDQRLAVGGEDEVAFLSQCFNEMASNLEQSRSETDERIRRATGRLEKKNEELASANVALQDANVELERQRALVAQSARLATIGEMAAGLAHEINNPLTTMRNLLHSLEMGLPEEDLRRRDIGIIGEEIDKINSLVMSYLQYARPAKARVTTVSPNSLLTRALDLLAPQLRQKGIEIVRDLDEGAPKIRADENQVGQVLLNILLNAIDASPQGEKLSVFSRVVTKGTGRAPARVELGVRDRGPGIRPEDRERVFHPFFTTKGSGSGLGLAISQRIVEEHGGEISFSSTPKEGTTFVIGLSVSEEPDRDADSHRR